MGHSAPGSEAGLRPFLQTLANLNRCLQLPLIVYAWAVHRSRMSHLKDNAATSAIISYIVTWAAEQKLIELPSWRSSEPSSPVQASPAGKEGSLMQSPLVQAAAAHAGAKLGTTCL